MSIALDILHTYRTPTQVQMRQMRAGQNSEGRALAVLMGACFLIFVAALPFLSRLAHYDPSIPFQDRMAGAFFAWLLMMPLVLYVLSLIIVLALKAFKISAPAHHVRMALFWALLASSPLWLFSGLAAGFTGESAGSAIAALAAIGAFVIFTLFGLVAAVRTGQGTAV
ncbi:MAG: YIP1 family protein [Pseudomonadota bacterium]